MFGSVAVTTLICALFPCTQVIQGPPNEKIDLSQPHSYHPHESSLYYFPHPLREEEGVGQVGGEGDLSIFPSNSQSNNVSSLYGSIQSILIEEGVVQEPKFSWLSPALINDEDSPHSPPAPEDMNQNINLKDKEESDQDYPLVQISDGVLKGFTMKTINNRTIYAWKSIPFAQPPIGELRFEAPLPNDPWSGVRDSMEDSPTCIQADYLQQYRIHGVEDCLYLNVFSPNVSLRNNKNVGSRDENMQKEGEPRPLLPVMVWIHGGGWFFSSSSLYGPAYLLDQDVILVTINYRLSMLGFLSTGDMVSPGNNGLKDQTLALKWVQSNIRAFGGDPDKVTIFGESAGGGSVHLHMLSPLSRGLFHGGISQSGCATCFWSVQEKEKALATTLKYSALLNCTEESSHEIISCLKQKGAEELVAMQLSLLEWSMYPVVIFGPVLEPQHPGSFLSEGPEVVLSRPGGVAPVPWLSGINADEGAINIAVLFLSNGTLEQINTDWDKYGPIFLGLSKDNKLEAQENAVKLSRQIRNHYFKEDEDINYENRGQAIKMFGDRYVNICGLYGIRLHSSHSPAPVYAYRLSYRGKYSILGLLGQQRSDGWGVSHLDDLIYLFNNTEYYPTLSPDHDKEEYRISSIITQLWANFAKMGRPYLNPDTTSLQMGNGLKEEKGGGLLLGDDNAFIWTPVVKDSSGQNLEKGGGTDEEGIDFLDISLQSKMMKDPFQDRLQFWNNLNLQDPLLSRKLGSINT